MASACYVYAILSTATRLPEGLTGLDGAPLATVPWRDLAAVISPIDPGALSLTTEQALGHEAVVEHVRRFGPALPARFGTVLPDAGAVARALAERHEVLAADLRRLGDKVELGLTVLWDQPDGGDGAPGGTEEPPPGEGVPTGGGARDALPDRPAGRAPA